MHNHLPIPLLAELPAGEIFETQIRSVPFEAFEGSFLLGEIISKASLDRLRSWHKGATVRRACLLAEHTTDPSFLEHLLARDSRNAVRLAVMTNPRLPFDTFFQAAQGCNPQMRHKLVTKLDLDSLLRLCDNSERYRSEYEAILRLDYLQPRRLAEQLLKVPADQWPVRLLAHSHPPFALLLLNAVVQTRITTADRLQAASANWPWDLYTAPFTNLLSQVRQGLARAIASSRPDPGPVLEQLPWSELVYAFSEISPAQLRLGHCRHFLDDRNRDTFANLVMRRRCIIDDTLVEWLLRPEQSGLLKFFVDRSHENLLVDGTALCAIYRHDSNRQAARDLLYVLFPFVDNAARKDALYQFPTAHLTFSTKLNRAVRSIPLIEALDLVERLESEDPDRAWAVLSVALSNGIPDDWVVVDRAHGLIVRLLRDPRVQEHTKGINRLLLSSRGSSYAMTPAMIEQLLDTAGQGPAGSAGARNALEIAARSPYWSTVLGGTTNDLLARLLRMAQQNGGFDHQDWKVAAPAALAALRRTDLDWVRSHASWVLGYLSDTLTEKYRNGHQSFYDLSELEQHLFPSVTIEWQNLRDGGAWRAVSSFLQRRFGTRATSWETALVLLGSWNGTLEDLARAVESI